MNWTIWLKAKWPSSSGVKRRFSVNAFSITLIVAAFAVSGCGTPSRCALAYDGTASCGILFGIATQEPTLEALTEAEEFAGRNYDLVYRFHGLDEEIHNYDERRIVRSGRALHINIEARVADPTNPRTWADIARGDQDSSLERHAKGLASLGAPVFVTFDHEMDLPRKSIRGTPAEFVAAWRHVHNVFDRAGASNVIWVWVASGLTQGLSRVGPLWPGNDVVDWISWDVYNHACIPAVDPATFEESLDVFYSWLLASGPTFGIDIRKPVMISELGSFSEDGDLTSRADWYAEIANVLAIRPEIRAVTLWDFNGTCDYRFTGVDSMRNAISRLGSQSVFAQLDLTDPSH